MALQVEQPCLERSVQQPRLPLPPLAASAHGPREAAAARCLEEAADLAEAEPPELSSDPICASKIILVCLSVSVSHLSDPSCHSFLSFFFSQPFASLCCSSPLLFLSSNNPSHCSCSRRILMPLCVAKPSFFRTNSQQSFGEPSRTCLHYREVDATECGDQVTLQGTQTTKCKQCASKQ